MSEPQASHRTEKTRGKRQLLEGVVVSDKMPSTVVVRVDRLVKNPRYYRYVRKSARFMAHDEQRQCHLGDRVLIVEDRPRSARKRWSVRSVISRAARV